MKGLARVLRRAPATVPNIRTVSIPLRNVTVNLTDPGAAVAWGTKALAALPVGNLVLMGVVAYLRYSSSSAGLSATYNITSALGTAATADNALAGAEVDLVAATAAGAATAKLSPLQRLTHTAANVGNVIDNTAANVNLNLNVTVPDADVTASSVLTLNGVIHLAVLVLGDD